jgi:hypothetical protein
MEATAKGDCVLAVRHPDENGGTGNTPDGVLSPVNPEK